MKKAFLGLAFALSCTLASAQELSPLGTGNTPMEPAAIGTAHKAKPLAHTTIQEPSGERTTFSMGGVFSNYLGGFILDGLQQGVYFDTDETTGETTVWFQNFFPLQLDNAWTHGTLKDGKVTIPVQRIFDYDNYGDGTDIRPLSIAMLKTEGKADESTGEQKVVVGYEDAFELIYNAGHFEMPDPDRLIGLVQFNEDGKMSVYSYTKELTMDRLTDAVPVSLPETAEPERYIYYFATSDGMYSYNDLNEVAIDGNDIYFNNLCPDYPGVWVKGNLSTDAEGNITGATVPSGQFMGEDIAYLLYFTAQVATGETDAKGAPITEPIDAATFTYDPSTRTFTMSPDQFVSETTMSGAIKGIYGSISVKYHGADVAATPVDPKIVDILDLSAYGYGVMVTFDIDNTGTNGEYLNPYNLYWTAMIDSKPLEFNSTDYPLDIEEGEDPLTLVPYFFSGAYDIGFGDTPNQRFYVFYTPDWNRAGVQLTYVVDNDVRRSSIVSITTNNKTVVEPDGVDGINGVVATTPATEQLYDLQGRQVGNAHHGIYIAGGRKIVK